MPRSFIRQLALPGLLAAVCLFQSTDALAVEIINKSDLRIGVAILRVQGELKTPLFIKILQPGASVESTPEEAGPFLLSVKVFDTDQTVRMKNVKATDVVQFKNGKLKRIRKKS
jgi:hypothetical protein